MDIFGISLNPLKKDDFFSLIREPTHPISVFTPNPEMLLKVKNDITFQQILKKASYLTSDGIGLYIAFQVLDSKLPFFFNVLLLPYYFLNLFFRRNYLTHRYGERVCGSDMTKYLLDYAFRAGKKIAVIDLYNSSDTRKTASQEIFSQKLAAIYPGLDIKLFVWDESQKESIIEDIKLFKPDYLFSTLGMKKQEQSIIEVMERCPLISFGAGVGSSFDTITGFQPTVPHIWKQAGFEWLYRLLFGKNKIKRLKRLYSAIFVFIFEVYRSKKSYIY